MQQKKLDDQIMVRMDRETKQAFMNKVKAEGKTASVLIMTFINAYLANEETCPTEVSELKSDVETLKREMETLRLEMMGKLVA